MNKLDANSAKHYQWEQLPAEPLKGGLTRRLISTERLMIAHVNFKKGDDVPRHAHENEQITYILNGALRFWLGADGEREGDPIERVAEAGRRLSKLSPG